MTRGYDKGLNLATNIGNMIKLAINAVIMAKAVNTPKYIVGTKFEKTMIRKPAVITIVV